MNFKDQWDTEMALQVLVSESVDSQTWADAAKWLMLFGPPDIKQVMLQASTSATSNLFPQLKPSGFNENGEPYFDIEKMAEVLGVELETLKKSLEDLEGETGFGLAAAEDDIFTIQ